MTSVKIYTTATCAYCHAEKEFLNEHNVEFEEIRVDQDQDKAEEMVALSGQLGVPFTVIRSGDKEDHILGFDQDRIADVLNLV